MSIKALTGLVPEWFTPEGEKEASDPAEFLLRPLKAPQVAKLQGYFNSESGEISGAGLYEAAVVGITDWKNVYNHEGKSLKFTRSNLDSLPYALILELGGQVLSRSFMSDEDEKNS
jgi:hypothetical protein